jgi:flagellar P-ring protein FlgI
VPGGAMVQVVRSVALPPSDRIGFGLHAPDFISARRIAEAINHELQTDAAAATDAGTVMLQVPATYRSSIPALVARLETLPVEVDAAARVVINERTGTVVLGGDVRLGAAAVAHGNLSVRIATSLEVSQPPAFSRGETTVVPRTDIEVEERDARLVELTAGTTLAQVVSALNTLGASPRDIIAIMQALKAAGALRAEIVIL